ncbi:nuak family kinase 1 [Xylocopa sonorina]|uniref:nuak family kinase 1 n=1 Tax=Xylocopa sonorina TaxID=1818115 RepID=UPI00403AF51B
MVVGEASIHNIMGGMESTGGVRLHNHKRKLKQRFDIIKKLGQGTYGKVQLGINKETGQEVAIKTIKKCKIETEADLIRIRREIQIMSSVQHPNIIHIYEVFENREKMVLVMEYAAGGELYDYLSERKVLTEHEARRIFRQIATAVFYCHKHKICHRDLKLENILLDQVGNAKIADFGLSNVFDEQRLLNTFCGSPLYASPEIVRGTPYHGPEVDCWSLGVLLYTLVYGAMPFDGSNFKRLVKQISQSDYFEPKKPSPASPLIKDMLTVCPGRRADIERICTHWWVNEGYEQNCLDIAEDLAAQTPVRLDLLLSLVPQSASAEKLLVGDQQPSPGDVANNVPSDTLIPTRCHSVGSLMEFDQNSADGRRIRRELLDEEPRTAPIAMDAKRKLETTPSMDETAAAGAKRKERSRRKEKREESEPRMYKSASRHHSAPIPNSITEEAMEVDPTVTVPISKTVDLNKIESTAACLELIKECSERSPSKERSKTPQRQHLDGPRCETLEKKEHVVVLDEQSDRNESSQENAFESSKGSEVASLLPNQEQRPTASASSSNFETSNDAVGQEPISLEATRREFKKLKEKALSLDSELSSEPPREPAVKTTERRRSKIFETAEKFNQMASNTENEKPKKIFIPGVNVGGAKRVFERKASLSSIVTPPPTKPTASKMIIDVSSAPDAKRNERPTDKSKQTLERDSAEKKEEEDRAEQEAEKAKKRAVDIITGAIGKPPVQRRMNGSPPNSPSSQEPKKLPLKIPVGANDLRSATVSVSTPVETKFPFDENTTVADKRINAVPVASEARNDNNDNAGSDDDDREGDEEPKMSSKMEITLKSATLPRSRKTSKAEISLSGAKSAKAETAPAAFKSEVEARIDAFQPQKLRTQRSEVAFPVAMAAMPHANRSSSLEPETKPRNIAPKERIIPIQVETQEQEQSQHSTSPPPPSKPPAIPQPVRSISQRSGSLSRQSTADSDTDSALGSTVGPEPIRKSPREYIIPIAVEGGGYVTPRSGSVEPESKTSTPTGTNAPRSRFGRPRRMSSLLSDASEDESPFSSLHRDSEDLLQRHMHRLRSSRPSRQPPEHADSLSSGEDDDDDGFELLTAENLFSTLLSRVRSLTQRLNVDDNRTTGFPSSRLFGRLGSNSSQTFWGLNKPLSSYQTYVETRTVTTRLSESQFRHSLSREGDIFSRKDLANSSNPGTPTSPGSHGTPSRETVLDIGSNTLPRDKVTREDVEAAEPTVTRVRKETEESLGDKLTPSLARRLCSRSSHEETGESRSRRSSSVPRENSEQTEYRDPAPLRSTLPRGPRTNYRSYRTDKIQEETLDDAVADRSETFDNSDCTSASVCDSNNTKSYETSSPTESSGNAADYKSAFENRLLAAENLIKESKLRNLGRPSSSENTIATAASKRRSCIPSLRLRSGSLTREPSTFLDRRKSFADSRDSQLLFGKLFGTGVGERADRYRDHHHHQEKQEEQEKVEEKPQKSKQRRISRFLRPDFFDTPREESRYAKEKDAQKAAENERRKSRFMRRKSENKPTPSSRECSVDREKEREREREREKELKNEINSLKRDVLSTGVEVEEEETKKTRDASPCDGCARNGFLHSLEKKLEKLRSNDQQTKQKRRIARPGTINGLETGEEIETGRERSAPPLDCCSSASASTERQAIAKRAVSAEELSPSSINSRTGRNSSKSKVSSVLGLFKTTDGKHRDSNSSRTILPSGSKRSPGKSAKPRETNTGDEDVTTVATGDGNGNGNGNSNSNSNNNSRIPTKLGNVNRPDKATSAGESLKRSPVKDGSIDVQDKATFLAKDKWKEKTIQTTVRDVDEHAEKESVDKRSSPGKTNKSSPRTALENGKLRDEKAERKPKKPIKKTSTMSEPSECNDSVTPTADAGSKKKRIVRAVKRIAKKSNDVDAEVVTKTTEEKGAKKKPTKASEQSKTKENGVETRTVVKRSGAAVPDRAKTQQEEGDDSRNEHRGNRSNLKLDLSKIPQHSFRNNNNNNAAANKKDSPSSDSPKSDRSIDRVSKVTHRGSITGNKIIIEKPLSAKDVAELKREVTECVRMIENHADRAEKTGQLPALLPDRASFVPKESPIDEPESFDSWSISSAEYGGGHGGQSRGPDSSHSPTSPSHSLYSRSNTEGNSESVIDRIRRRSFYSRFNDRRRPSLTAPPPGLNLPSSATLPRKFSFTGHSHQSSREHRDRGHGLTRTGYNRSVDRLRYSDELASSPPLSGSYDPIRRHLRSPTFDLSASRPRYHSADFATADSPPELAPTLYRTPVTGLSSLPRTYGTTLLLSEPKTVEYYQELLAPSTPDHFSPRRSTTTISTSEYHNGTFESPTSNANAARRKTYATENATTSLSSPGEQSTEQARYGWFTVPLIPRTNDPRLRFPKKESDFIGNELKIRHVQRGLPSEKFSGIPFRKLQRCLEQESLYAELIQWLDPCNQAILLASFETSLADLLYPVTYCKRLLAGVDVDLLMDPSKYFPGIIAPKIEVSTKTMIEEVKTSYHPTIDGTYVINPKLIDSKRKSPANRKRPVKGIIRQQRVCHDRSKAKGQVQACAP